MFTQHPPPRDRELFLAAGMDGFPSEPIKVHALGSAVDRALERFPRSSPATDATPALAPAGMVRTPHEMTDARKLTVLSGFSVFCMLVSISWVSLGAAFAIGIVSGIAVLAPLHRALPDRTHEGLWELAPVLTFIPLVALRITTPGEDAAMYAAIARALLDHSSALSAAYPSVEVAMYPRGFPGGVALLSPIFGALKANLVAAALCYVVFVEALAIWLRGFVPRRTALIVALFLSLASRNVPLGFFSWGGNPTILAFGMALIAITVAADLTSAAVVLGCAALILGGAFAVHPIGAFGGAACAPFALLCRGQSVQRAKRLCLVALAVAPLMLSFKHFGPVVSAREAQWIAGWQAGPAHLIHDRFGFFALDYLEAFTRTCGVALTLLTCFCLWVERARLTRLFGWGLLYVAALMAIGPRLPLLGPFIYADRLSPLWLVILSPAVSSIAPTFPVRPSVRVAVCALLLVVTRIGFRLGDPLIHDDEAALMPCIREKVPSHAWVVASYGQGGQWLPALTGNPITQPHTHCSLFDETDQRRPTIHAHYQLISPHKPQFNVPTLAELPAAETLCMQGSAKLVRLVQEAPPTPGVY